MAGIAGLDFLDDVISTLNDNWINNSGGKKPHIVKVWNEKVVGFGTNNDERIIVNLDSESINPFSLRYTDGEGNTIYDWLHDVAINIDIITGKSEERVLELVNETVRILKRNVLLVINENQYIQMLPTGVTSLNENYRNIYRYMIDVECKRVNP